jgi:hypothetical protein
LWVLEGVLVGDWAKVVVVEQGCWDLEEVVVEEGHHVIQVVENWGVAEVMGYLLLDLALEEVVVAWLQGVAVLLQFHDVKWLLPFSHRKVIVHQGIMIVEDLEEIHSVLVV